MTTHELAAACGFTVLCPGDDRPVEQIYCCDLLSLVMGRAPADCAWITVMGNTNAVAVAVLADAACIILAEGMPAEEAALQKAAESGLTVLATDLPVWEAGMRIRSAQQ